jgi:hypothetical protein
MTQTAERPRLSGWRPGFITIKGLSPEHGDARREWDKGKPEEVEDARASFDHFKQLGYKLYELDASGKQGKEMKTFDPNAERLIAVKQMAGG